MALNGTLEELAVLDVVQFVNQAHLSGCLVLTSGSKEAELFYRKGGLVHARLGDTSGPEVLVLVVDWTSGNFSFNPGVVPSEESIRMDFHRAVMYALKTRDERKLETKKREAEMARQREAQADPDRQLAEAASSFDFVHHAFVFDASGMLASATRKGASEDLTLLCQTMIELTRGYARGRLRRAVIDDEKGTILVSSLPKNRWLVVEPERGIALGAVMVGMGRLVAMLEKLVWERKDALQGTLVGAA